MRDTSLKPSRRRKERRTEFDFINLLRTRCANHFAQSDSSLIPHPSSLRRPSSLRYGIGDDGAVLYNTSSNDTIVTSDLLVEDIDFRRDSPPALLGHKALAVSLSDIAAMGGHPQWAMLSVGVPRDVWESNFLDEFYRGFLALADEHAVTLIGGDISRTPLHIVIDSIVLGDSQTKRAVFRSGARPTDLIFVTGTLGGAAAGLSLLENGARWSKARLARMNTGVARPKQVPNRRQAENDAREQLILRQLRPAARVSWGQFLGENKIASAMIDLSDGLSSDLSHLCRESEVGARIVSEQLPINPNIVAAHLEKGLDPASLALNGGEDFELLFTVRRRHVKRLPSQVGGVPITQIGEITENTGRVELSETSLTRLIHPRGFEHFRNSD